MSRYSDARELGTTMGVAQTFAGLARVVAPLLATTIFQRLGHAWPFYVAGGVRGACRDSHAPDSQRGRPAAPGGEEAQAT